MRSRVSVKDVSYIISVSIGKGCYRHLRVSGLDTLHDFADTILWAFGFAHDHLYSFFMDDRWWSAENAYHSPYAQEAPSADSIQLYRLRFEKGRTFKFLFDYGDEWRFQCKVLQVLNEETKEDEIVRSKGKAPEQYPDCEDIGCDDNGDEKPIIIYNNAKRPDSASHTPEEESLKDLHLSIPDEVMEAAFRFRSEKLWKKLNDSDLFAVQLSSGEIGYCCIMGGGGEYTALGLYIGDNGIWSLDYLRRTVVDTISAILAQNCLQLELNNKSELPDLFIEPVIEYAGKHGIGFKGKKQYPSFLKFESYFMPDIITGEADFRCLLEAIRAANAVSERLKTEQKSKLGFSKNTDQMPFLIPENDGFRWEMLPYPEIKPYSYPRPVIDPERAEAVKALPQKGKLESNIVFSSDPVQGTNEQRSFFPAALFSAGSPAKLKGRIDGLGNYPSAVSGIMEQFIEKMLKAGTRPAEIITNGECSLIFFSEFCEQCGITLTHADELPKVHKLVEKLTGEAQDEPEDIRSVLEPIINLMEHLSGDDLRTMPDSLKDIIRQIIDTDIISPELRKKLKKIM